MRQCTEAQFLKDVSGHQMRVIRDDGKHRHIRFERPGSTCMHFELITWPGYLAYVGDMGSYVFSRLPDMFQFFRMGDGDLNHNERGLSINPDYWSEKIEAADKSAGIKKFSEDAFVREVKLYLADWMRNHRSETTKDERRELSEAVEWDVLGAEMDGGGYRKSCSAYDFRHHVNDTVGDFEFQDFFEIDFSEWTFRFLWCCYALAWGVQQYDASKVAETSNQPTETNEQRKDRVTK